MVAYQHFIYGRSDKVQPRVDSSYPAAWLKLIMLNLVSQNVSAYFKFILFLWITSNRRSITAIPHNYPPKISIKSGVFLAARFNVWRWHLHGLTGSAIGHRSIAPGFKPLPWLGYVRRVFHLSLCLITYEGHPLHLACHVRNSGHKIVTLKIFSFHDRLDKHCQFA